MQKIKEYNKYAESRNISFRMGVNFFTDLDDSEFASRFGGYIPIRNHTFVKKDRIIDKEMLKVGRQISPEVKSKNPKKSNIFIFIFKRFYLINKHFLRLGLNRKSCARQEPENMQVCKKYFPTIYYLIIHSEFNESKNISQILFMFKFMLGVRNCFGD